MWFPWSEIDRFGVIKAELTGKVYHEGQISRKCFGKIFASILRFMIFLRPETEPKNGIMWFPWSEIDKFGVIESELTAMLTTSVRFQENVLARFLHRFLDL